MRNHLIGPGLNSPPVRSKKLRKVSSSSKRCSIESYMNYIFFVDVIFGSDQI